jgi:hypothetical protein
MQVKAFDNRKSMRYLNYTFFAVCDVMNCALSVTIMKYEAKNGFIMKSNEVNQQKTPFHVKLLRKCGIDN